MNKLNLVVLNGPNLNMLGVREPDIYGKQTYRELCERICDHAEKKGVSVQIKQSNHEGELVDWIQAAYGNADGIVINPAAYTHTSIALLDALKAVGLPAVEVHISDVTQREAYRQVSYVREYCEHSIMGHGFEGYLEAIDYLIERCEVNV